MRSRVIFKFRERLQYYYEKFMEWCHSITYNLIPRKTVRNNLIEEYTIYERYAGEPFVKDFLNERTRNTIINRYCIKIKTAPNEESVQNAEKETQQIIGKVRLFRKRIIIDEATLIIKKESNLIYWNFNK